MLGLARSEASEAALRAAGFGVVRGGLADMPGSPEVAAALAAVDVAVHAAKNRDGERAHELGDRGFVASVLAENERRRGGGLPELAVVYTSGCFSHGSTAEDAVITEREQPPAGPAELAWRLDNERRLAAGLKLCAVARCALVWGRAGSHGSRIHAALRDRGLAEVFCDGQAGRCGRLPWVHVDDLGEAYAILAERLKADPTGAASGTYNVTDGRDSPEIVDVFAALARALGGGGELRRVPATTEFARFMVQRQGRVSADKIRALGWAGPRHGVPTEHAAEWARALVAARE